MHESRGYVIGCTIHKTKGYERGDCLGVHGVMQTMPPYLFSCTFIYETHGAIYGAGARAVSI